MDNKPWDSALEEEVAKKIRERGYIYLSEVYEALGIPSIHFSMNEET